MAKQLTDVLDLENEITQYRDALFLIKQTTHRIRNEYFQGQPLSEEKLIDIVDEELEAISLIIENTLF